MDLSPYSSSIADKVNQAVVYHDGIQYCLVEFPLSSLYLNAFLANLNTREYIRGEHENYNSFELGSGSGGNGLPPSNGLNFASTQHLQVILSRQHPPPHNS